MGSERRQHARLARPLEGTWSGASGATACRISDISSGGCFVQSLADPKPGETVEVTVSFGVTMAFAGTVVYVEKGMGFAVRFDERSEEDQSALREMLERLTPDRA